MTQEEKKLLLIDLCARLSYGVKIASHQYNYCDIRTPKGIVGDRCYFNDNPRYDGDCPIDEIKLYLRPMQTMTEEEREEWADLFNLELDKLNEIDDENKAEELAPYYFGKSHQVSIDWLNKKMFDHYTDEEGKTMIEKGLA